MVLLGATLLVLASVVPAPPTGPARSGPGPAESGAHRDGGSGRPRLLFLLMPVVALVPMSFSGTRWLVLPPTDLSFRWYAEFLTSRDWREATATSLTVAAAAMGLATVLGTLAGVALARGRFPGRHIAAASCSRRSSCPVTDPRPRLLLPVRAARPDRQSRRPRAGARRPRHPVRGHQRGGGDARLRPPARMGGADARGERRGKPSGG